MADNGTGTETTTTTTDKETNEFKERNQQVLNNISQLQTQEKNLYSSLDDATLTTEQKQLIINKINEISVMRMNIYATLKDMYSYYQKNISMSQTTLGQEIQAIDVLENELNEAKRRLNLLDEQKNNKLRLVQINTYYSKRYNAHSNLFKTVVLTCIPVIFLTFLFNRGLLSSSIYGGLTAIVLVIGAVLIGLQLIDMSNRDNMNWDEYNWYFDESSAPSAPTTTSTTSTSSSPWTATTASSTCIGSSCCYEGSTYDESKNMCIPNSIYQTTAPTETTTAPIETTAPTGTTEGFKGLDKYGYTQVKTSLLS